MGRSTPDRGRIGCLGINVKLIVPGRSAHSSYYWNGVKPQPFAETKTINRNAERKKYEH
jgi:hypothetical protein